MNKSHYYQNIHVISFYEQGINTLEATDNCIISNEEALEMVREANQLFILETQSNPDHWKSHIALANGYAVLGEKDKQLNHLKYAEGINPNEYEILLSLASFHLEENPCLALIYLKKLVNEDLSEMGSSLPFVYYDLGQIYYRIGDTIKAKEYYDLASENDWRIIEEDFDEKNAKPVGLLKRYDTEFNFGTINCE